MWMTRGPFRRLPKSLCDFGDMTPHTLVGGAQTTLTATASARADRRDCPSEAWGPRGKTHTPPLDVLDRHAGGTGAVGITAPKWLVTLKVTTRVGKGLSPSRPCSPTGDQGWCLVLRAVPTAPVTPAHRSKASGGRDWVSPRGPKASLGSFRRSARTLALAVRVV